MERLKNEKSSSATVAQLGNIQLLHGFDSSLWIVFLYAFSFNYS